MTQNKEKTPPAADAATPLGGEEQAALERMTEICKRCWRSTPGDCEVWSTIIGNKERRDLADAIRDYEKTGAPAGNALIVIRRMLEGTL